MERLAVTTPLFILLAIPLLCSIKWVQIQTAAAAATHELVKGFTATPELSVSSFQPLLTDSTGNFSLGFLRVNSTLLALSVLHVPSAEPLWQADMARLARWSESTQLFFNGSLVISDRRTKVFWSTGTNGDRVSLLNTSNLQIHKLDDDQFPNVLWQSFYFPTNTLVENQNFTANMSLVSSNGLYSMRLGEDFIGLYENFEDDQEQIYWKHGALEAKAEIVKGQGPIYIQLDSGGFLGMYQRGSTPVDVEAFYSFQHPLPGFRRLRVEPNGDLKGYYWTGINWVLDYQAIKDQCELPGSCGSYGLCRPGSGCSCIDESTMYNPDEECLPPETGSLCRSSSTKGESKFRVLRRKGIELPNKELTGYETMPSLEQCERSCENNCSCWGAVYNNASGFCYRVDYPIRTLIGVGDETKMGYFKVREGPGKKVESGFGLVVGLVGATVLAFGGAVGFGVYTYRAWKRKGGKGLGEELGEVNPGPYKSLGAASFRSIEMT